MFEIKGKVALITGGVSGIGLAIAIELLENELLAVALVDVNEDLGEKVSEDLRKKYKHILFVKADVRDKNSFEDAFQDTIQTFRQLDIVINCAGIGKEKKIDDVIDINYKGTVNGCLLALDRYLSKYQSGNGGVILNIASIAGLTPIISVPIYSSTKFAVIGLTRALGTDPHYQKTNVRVLAICPGFTDTPSIKTDEDNFLSPVYRDLHASACKEIIIQPSSYVAKASVPIISEGNNGSIWVAKDKQPPYEVVL